MKLSKNKKGLLWTIIIGFVICFIIAGVLFGVIGKWKLLGSAALNFTHFGLSGGDAPNTFLFDAKTISIDPTSIYPNGDIHCDPSTSTAADKDRRFTCKPGDISFVTDIYNGGPVGDDNSQRRFYGGIVVCKITCSALFGCSLVDKNCDEKVYSSSDTCTVKSGDTKTCDAGSYNFQEGEYLVSPSALCYLDQVYGCYEVGMTESPKRTNTAVYLRLTISK